jgi:hypothetical protein
MDSINNETTWELHHKDHELLEEKVVAVKDDVAEVKKKVEELAPKSWPNYVKIGTIIAIIGFISTLVALGVNYGKVVTKSEFDPVATDVAVIKERLKVSTDDRQKMNEKLDLIIQRVNQTTLKGN